MLFEDQVQFPDVGFPPNSLPSSPLAIAGVEHKVYAATIALSKLLPMAPHLLPYALKYFATSSSPLHSLEAGTSHKTVLPHLCCAT